MCLKEMTAYENPSGGRPIFGWAGVKAGLREIKLPCGHCASCIKNYYSYWATRGYYELLNWSDNFFCTFTFDPEHLPKDMSLDKEAFQRFIKRVKKAYGSSKSDPVRQIYCGEYGDKNKRPHYHAIFFNLHLDDLVESRRTDQGHLCYTSRKLSSLWGQGIVEISEATPATVAYLFKYILKKKSRKEKKQPLLLETPDGVTWEVAHEFIESSRNPGIGAHMRNSVSIRKGFLSVDGVPRSLPPYFLNYLKNVDPRFYEELKAQRFDYAVQQAKISQQEKDRRDAHFKMLQSQKKRD